MNLVPFAGPGPGPGLGSARSADAATPASSPSNSQAPARGAPDPHAAQPDFLLRLLAAMASTEELSGEPVESGVSEGELGIEPDSSEAAGSDAEAEAAASRARFTEGALDEVASARDPGRRGVDEVSAAPRPSLGAVEGVHPELVARVERVADRMWSEFGHRVEVVEGHRSQLRQDQLYAQGRTAPGPQVTWTRNSAHTRGEAVDVRIDGGWENTRAFERLQQVAREEGIRTLGMRDAGHLELPRGAGFGAAGNGQGGPGHGGAGQGADAHAPLRTPAPFQPQAQLQAQTFSTTAAPTAQPVLRSGVAGVAQVARVARVARPGNTGGPVGSLADSQVPQATSQASSGGSTPGTADARVAVSAPAPISAAALESSPASWSALLPSQADPGGAFTLLGRAPSQLQGEAAAASGDGARGAEASVPFIELASTGSESGRLSNGGSAASSMADLALQTLGGAREGAGAASLLGAGGVAGAMPGAGTLLRAEQIRAIQAASGPGGNLSMELSNVDGAGTDLHLAMRGRDVSARIDAVDPLQARALRLRLGELRSTLSERGLEAERLGVRLLQSEPLVMIREGERGGEAAGRQPGEQAPGEDRGQGRGREREQDDARSRGDARPGDPGFQPGFQEHYERETR